MRHGTSQTLIVSQPADAGQIIVGILTAEFIGRFAKTVPAPVVIAGALRPDEMQETGAFMVSIAGARSLLGSFRRHWLQAVGQWSDPVRNPGASEFEVDLWTLSRFVLEKIVPVVGAHPYPLNELLLMTGAACRLKPSVVFDWGTHIGASARIFFECERAFKLGYEIHSIDLPPDATHVEHPGREHGRLVKGLDKVHLHRGDGVKIALAQWQKLGRPKRPLFFVDGDHAYESVRDELNEIFWTIPDASALAHDTFFQSAESKYNVGPARAIDEIVGKFPSRFRIVRSGLGLPGMTLLENI